MRTCEDFASDVTDYIDGRMPLGPRASMWLHSAVCKSCRAYQRQMTLVKNAAPNAYQDEEVPEAKVDELAKLFRSEAPE